MPSENTDTQQEFIWVNAKGQHAEEGFIPKGPFFKARTIPDCKLLISPDLSSPFTEKQKRSNTADIGYCIMYMAQSDTGREALRVLSDNRVRIGFRSDLPPEDSVYNLAGNYILLDPLHEPELQHLNLLQAAAHAAATLHVSVDTKPSESGYATKLFDAINALGIANVALHGEECIDARIWDRDRFVPPQLETSLQRFMSTSDLFASATEEKGAAPPAIVAQKVPMLMRRLLNRAAADLQYKQSQPEITGSAAVRDMIGRCLMSGPDNLAM